VPFTPAGYSPERAGWRQSNAGPCRVESLVPDDRDRGVPLRALWRRPALPASVGSALRAPARHPGGRAWRNRGAPEVHGVSHLLPGGVAGRPDDGADAPRAADRHGGGRARDALGGRRSQPGGQAPRNLDDQAAGATEFNDVYRRALPSAGWPRTGWPRTRWLATSFVDHGRPRRLTARPPSRTTPSLSFDPRSKPSRYSSRCPPGSGFSRR
jgi:hypothetical protein